MEDIPTIVTIAVDDFCDAAKTLNLKAFPTVRINLAVNVARTKAGMPPIDLFTKVPEEAAAAQVTRIEKVGRSEEATVTKVTLKVAYYFDHGCRLEVKPCTEDDTLKLLAEWTSKMWLAPAADLDLTNNQWSVLKQIWTSAYFLLFTFYFLLFTFYFLLFTFYFLLFTFYFLLFTFYFLLFCHNFPFFHILTSSFCIFYFLCANCSFLSLLLILVLLSLLRLPLPLQSEEPSIFLLECFLFSSRSRCSGAKVTRSPPPASSSLR